MDVIHTKLEDSKTLCGYSTKWGEYTYNNAVHLIRTFMICEGRKGLGWHNWCDDCLTEAFKILDRMRNEA